MNNNLRIASIASFSFLALVSVYFVFHLKFTFDFEQFFPTGDPDLEFFLEFREKFEPDDNFMLVAVRREQGVFQQDFLNDFHAFTLDCRKLEPVERVNSITTTKFPIKLPIGGFTAIPAIDRKNPDTYARDSLRLVQDERLAGRLISEDGKTVVALLKTIDSIEQGDAERFIADLDLLVAKYEFEEYHYLGRANFQKEIVRMQKREILVSGVVSMILVLLIMFVIFRRFWSIFIALISIGLGMLLFMGLLGATGLELNAMSALYPVLMIIVGTSDVIHIMSKYMDELALGKSREVAIGITIREIGLATLFTSVTTAIGFATLMTSRVPPIKGFGLNAAVGVMIAYVTVLLFTTAVLSYFDLDKLISTKNTRFKWTKWMDDFYLFTLKNPRGIAWGGAATIGLCLFGISLVTTNYKLTSNMPMGEKITEDFTFFEREFSGFRPFEIAVSVKNDTVEVNDYQVVKEIDKIEKYLRTHTAIQSPTSITTIYKSLNQASKGNRSEYYEMPETEARFNSYQRMAERFPASANVLVSKDQKHTRIAGSVLDIGADKIRAISDSIDYFIATQTDTTLLLCTQTGTGVIIDKNSQYVRNSIINGLGMAILIVSLLMAILFQNLRMVVISLIPNVLPLLVAGGILGYLGIELEAGISIVFAVVFGIAVDDTIHFLSKYRISRAKGLDMEAALRVTFTETGKAICLTSIILFFGFMVMLFSIHPPSITVGLLIAATLVSALFGDLLFIPVLIRYFGGGKK